MLRIDSEIENDNMAVTAAAAEPAPKKRRKGLIALIVIAAVIHLAAIVVAMIFLAPRMSFLIRIPKTFTKEGMSITLTNEFKEEIQEPFTAVYVANRRGAVVFTSNVKIKCKVTVTLRQVCEYIMVDNGVPSDYIRKDGDRFYFEYDYKNPDDGIEYHYKSYVLQETESSFWLVTFCTTKSMESRNASDFNKWVDTIKFN